MQPKLTLSSVAFVVLLAGTAAMGQGAGQKSVFPPTSDDYQVLWRRLEDYARQENWEAVHDGLQQIVDLFQNPEENSVISNGAGHSIGIRRLTERFLGRLPADYRRRILDYADGLLEKAWRASEGRIETGERRRLRHVIVRDHRRSRLLVPALKEAIDAALLEGHWERVQALVEQGAD